MFIIVNSLGLTGHSTPEDDVRCFQTEDLVSLHKQKSFLPS